MKIFPIILFFIVHINCNKNSSQNVIGTLNGKDGKYLGTLIGIPIKDKLYSKLFIVNKNSQNEDTLYFIDRSGFRNTSNIEIELDLDDYKGFKTEIIETDKFNVWLETLDGGSASDGNNIQWVDSLNQFRLEEFP